MALRVLLADNSETIKKVIQLTLQDFEIDLRIVTHGIDVLDVALKFKPDIIFVDILLQKKSGYEVSKELKNNVHLKHIPVVLMWSGFMEFDEPKAKESLADARLEKPFDADTLKNLVNKLVKKNTAPNVTNFLDFPAPPVEKPAAPTAAPKVEKHEDPLKSLEKIKNESEKFKPIELPDLINDLQTDDEPAIDEFEMQSITKTTGFGYRSPPETDPSSQTTKSFVLDLPEDTNVGDIPMDIEKIDKVEDMSFLLNSNPDNQPAMPTKANGPRSAPPSAPPPTQTPVAASPPSTPSAQDIERIVREEVREAIDKVVWQVVPELASQLIKKELDRLLKDNEPKP